MNIPSTGSPDWTTYADSGGMIHQDGDPGPEYQPDFEEENNYDSVAVNAAPPVYSNFKKANKTHVPDAGSAGESEYVQKIIRLVIASLHKQSSDVVSSVITRITQEKLVLARVPASWLNVVRGVLEVLAFECTALVGVAIVDFNFLPAANNYSNAVAKELKLLAELQSTDSKASNPLLEFEALVEGIQAGISRQAALKLVDAVNKKTTSEIKMKRFREIPPPTRERQVQNSTWAKTALQWMDDSHASHQTASSIILSSGFPSLDIASGGSKEHSGLIVPGEFWVGGAGTGHGKSAFTRRVFTAMLEDLTVGWGMKHARGILGFTEEEAWDVARAAQLDQGQAFHHLASNAVLAKLGQSRRRAISVVYDIIIDSVKKAEATGTPITEFLPYFYCLDYVQAIHEPGENPDTDGVARTADLMMRGIAAWDPEMMGSISGVNFSEYAGMAWPKGMEDHRVAVLCLSQLRKEGKDHTVFYRSGRSVASDFAVVDANGTQMWNPLEDDYAIPNRSDLRGSGVLLNHATGLIFFHRSKPTASVVKDPKTGKSLGLTDTRARFIVPKARKSVSMPYVPMRFDSDPDGFRGQFYDDLAHTYCVEEKRAEVAASYRRKGDPMLPLRPLRVPWDTKY
jgi:hypothetical protein